MPVAEMTIGEFIASARADRKLSLRAFAQYIGTSQTAVSDWEKGNRVPDPESCRKLARYLHMPEEEVLRLAGHMAPAEELSHGAAAGEMTSARGRRLAESRHQRVFTYVASRNST